MTGDKAPLILFILAGAFLIAQLVLGGMVMAYLRSGNVSGKVNVSLWPIIIAAALAIAGVMLL